MADTANTLVNLPWERRKFQTKVEDKKKSFLGERGSCWLVTHIVLCAHLYLPTLLDVPVMARSDILVYIYWHVIIIYLWKLG